jgi:hypothetical protein
MEGCLFVAAMGPPGGGRSAITQRYQRHFNLTSVTDFDDATLQRIFTTVLDWHLTKSSFPSNIQAGPPSMPCSQHACLFCNVPKLILAGTICLLARTKRMVA